MAARGRYGQPSIVQYLFTMFMGAVPMVGTLYILFFVGRYLASLTGQQQLVGLGIFISLLAAAGILSSFSKPVEVESAQIVVPTATSRPIAATPTRRPTSIPAPPTSPKIVTRIVAQNTFEDDQAIFLWNLAKPQQEGDFEVFTIQGLPEGMVFWGWGTCFRSQEHLEAGWPKFQLHFTVNGKTVGLHNFVELNRQNTVDVDGYGKQSAYCRMLYGALEEWPIGEYTLRVEKSLTKDMYDGWYEYKKGAMGGYIFNVTVTSVALVLPTNTPQTLSTPSDCTHWSKVTLEDVGKNMCVYGEYLRVDEDYRTGDTKSVLVFSDDPGTFQIWSSTKPLWAHMPDGEASKCIMFTGYIEFTGVRPVIILQSLDRLLSCQ